MTYLPPFLRDRDPDREHDMQWARDAYALRGREDRAIADHNDGYGDGPFTVEDALGYGNRLAAEQLPARKRWTP